MEQADGGEAAAVDVDGARRVDPWAITVATNDALTFFSASKTCWYTRLRCCMVCASA